MSVMAVVSGSFPRLWAVQFMILQLVGYRLFAGGVRSMWSGDDPVAGGMAETCASLSGNVESKKSWIESVCCVFRIWMCPS